MTVRDGEVVKRDIPSKFPKVTTVTMSYIPFQEDIETYSLEKSLEVGTAFPVLDKPFLGGSEK